MPKKTFLLIDGSSLLFRAFYAIRNLTTKDGLATNGVYGFLTMYLKAKEEIQPDYLLVAFDRAGKSFRAKDYADYKGNRQETPEELKGQFGLVKELLDAMGIAHYDADGFEADDIIGSLSLRAEEAGIQSYLLTGDRDYFQLVDAHTMVLYTKKGISQLEKVDKSWIADHYDGLSPKDLIEVKGLQGDSSDNIPGVRGIGEKTAIKLIKEYGTIDQLYENLDQISGKKMKENLQEEKNLAFLSRKLGTIFRQMPLEEDLDAYAPKAVDFKRLADLLDRLEFHSLSGRLLPKEEKKILSAKAKLSQPSTWPALAQALSQEAEIPFFLLGDGDNYIYAKAIYAAFYAKGQAYLLDLRGEEEAFRENFAGLFQSERCFLAYDSKRSMVLLKNLGIDFRSDYRDLMLMEYLLDPNRASYDPQSLAHSLFQVDILKEDDLLGKGKGRITFDQVEVEKLASYAQGLLQTLDMARPLLEEELSQAGMEDLFLQIENPLARVLAHMESRGIAIDQEALERIDREISDQVQAVEQDIYQLAGQEFNLNSPKQLGKLLFEDLGIPHGKKTKTGYSTSAEILEKLQDAHPIIGQILEYRKLAKIKSTYIDGFRPHIHADGRVRSIFRQNVAATGRISSTEPNLQNIPVRTEEGRRLRAIFVAGEGKKLVDCDYSQIELRLLASLSGDRQMIETFHQGIDIHRKTAAEVNHIPVEEVTPLQRSYAKAVNFGIIYGISDYGLSRDLNIPRKEAKDYIDRYKASYPQVDQYMKEIVEEAKEKGYVDTAYGRRRQIPELKSKNFNVRGFGERIALNAPIQGTAADVIKLAMIEVDKILERDYPQAGLVLQIHDELIIEADQEHAEELARLLSQVMEAVGHFRVPLVAEPQIGHSWLDVK